MKEEGREREGWEEENTQARRKGRTRGEIGSIQRKAVIGKWA